jgi:hypothetical protein
MSKKTNPLDHKWENLSKFVDAGIPALNETLVRFNGHTIETEKAIYTMIDGNVYRNEKKLSGNIKSRKSKRGIRKNIL